MIPEVAVYMETSGAVRDAVAALGYRAVSVDLLPSQVGGPHEQGDAFAHMAANRGRFAAAVFHPTCTYHTVSAAWAFPDPDFDRYPDKGGYHQRVRDGTLTGADRREARRLAEADVERIKSWDGCPLKIIENPRGTISTRTSLGSPAQVVQPYEFGSDASKATCFWMFDASGRPIIDLQLPIDPANYVKPRMFCGACKKCSPYDAAFGHGCIHCGAEAGTLKPRWANQTDSGQNRLSPGDARWQVRSDTYPGIAKALAQTIHLEITKRAAA